MPGTIAQPSPNETMPTKVDSPLFFWTAGPPESPCVAKIDSHFASRLTLRLVRTRPRNHQCWTQNWIVRGTGKYFKQRSCTLLRALSVIAQPSSAMRKLPAVTPGRHLKCITQRAKYIWCKYFCSSQRWLLHTWQVFNARYFFHDKSIPFNVSRDFKSRQKKKKHDETKNQLSSYETRVRLKEKNATGFIYFDSQISGVVVIIHSDKQERGW